MSFFMAGALCQEALEVLGVCPFISPVVIVVVVVVVVVAVVVVVVVVKHVVQRSFQET